MKKILLAIPAAILAVAACTAEKKVAVSEPTLKDYYADKFLIGGAINMNLVNGLDPKGDSVVRRHFNTIVAENCMKSQEIHPQEDVWFWDDADKFVDYGVKNNMAIVGHCLVWHSQLSPWFPYDSTGAYVTPEVLKQRMKDHITTLMTRYKGKIMGWDVVNEAIEDDGSYRRSPFYEILGEEYIPLAFQYAQEADPDCELYINDYSMFNPAKRDRYIKIVNDLKARGLRCDAIGMQAHYGLDFPDFAEFEKSLVAFGETGSKVMLTEWDMTALPAMYRGANISNTQEFNALFNPYTEALPDSVAEVWNARMDTIVTIVERHAPIVSRLNAWGSSDNMSWRNDWPMRGRTDYPLLFDREYNLKPFLQKRLDNI